MTINATAMWLLALYQVVAEEQNPDLEPLEVAHQLAGTTQNDIIKEYLSRGTYVFPPEHSLRLISDVISYTVNEIPKWNPINICSYHLQEAGRDADPGARLRAVHGDRGARRGQGLGTGLRGRLRQGRRPDLLLRQRRRAVHRGDLQDARVRAAVGRDHPRALRRDRREDAPLPLRRPGQLARADRGAAGEQRAADRARDARRHAEQERPRPRRTAARVERGARPAASLGPAVVAATPAGAGLRVRPAGVRRHLRGLDRDRGQGGPARRGRPRRDGPGPGHGWRDRGRRVRLHEAAAGQLPRRPPRRDRERRGHRRRREQVRDHRALAADRRPGRRDPGRRPRGRALRDRRPGGVARGARPGRGRPRPRGAWPRRPRPTRT